MNDAAVAALSPEALAHLREHLAVIDGHERGRVEMQVERWGRLRAAHIAVEDEERRSGVDPWTPV